MGTSTDIFRQQQVPASPEERRRIRARLETISENEPLTRNNLERLAGAIVEDERHLAWTMVLIGSRLWRRRVAAVPFERRILLLPHCMRNADRCPAVYDAEGLHCVECGACELGSLKSKAETLGYLVMIAEGSPIVMQWILGGKADAILGVGCLTSLERAFEKLQLAGIPAMAVPLHASTCRNSETDLDQVYEMIQTPFESARDSIDDPEKTPPTWIHLLRGAGRLFEAQAGETPPSDEAIDQTAVLGLEFLRRGGKFYRPFITLAVFDALTGSRCTRPDGDVFFEQLPDWVKRAAGAVEIFHKASLLHDDIEDDDDFRYGLPTLHRSHGTAVAINVGDYLIGRGYQRIAELHREIPATKRVASAEIVVEMLHKLSRAHTWLSMGQGAELAWKSTGNENLTPRDVLRIYVLKTSPAFEAALGIGVLSAAATGSVDREFYRETEETLARFSRHLGVAFQIKNDLDDWLPDRLNKQRIGLDVRHNRPTLLRALTDPDIDLQAMPPEEVYERFQRRGVFEKARRLVEKYAAKARETSGQIEHLPFQRLLLHFVETIASL